MVGYCKALEKLIKTYKYIFPSTFWLLNTRKDLGRKEPEVFQMPLFSNVYLNQKPFLALLCCVIL
jgi:hypothetical protein